MCKARQDILTIDLKKDTFRINHVMREMSCEIVIREVGCEIVSDLHNSFPTAFAQNSSDPPMYQCTILNK